MDLISSSSNNQRRSQKGLMMKMKPRWVAILSSYFILFCLYSTSNFFIPLLHFSPSDLLLDSSPSHDHILLPDPSPTTVHFIHTLQTNASLPLNSVSSDEVVGEALQGQRITSIGRYIILLLMLSTFFCFFLFLFLWLAIVSTYTWISWVFIH